MAHARPKGKARVGALSLIHVVPDHQREAIKECVAVARMEGRSRAFVHAAIISSDIRVVVKHPSELETVLGGSEEKNRESDEIITAQELSRLTLRYEEVYKNFYHVKTCLNEMQISHYVIRRNLNVGEFNVIQYDDDKTVILERRQRGLIERFFGDDKTHLPVTALIIVADFLMPFVSDAAPCSPRHPTSTRHARAQSDFSRFRSQSDHSVMYEIDLGENAETRPPPTEPQTDRSHGYRRRVVSMSDNDAMVSTKSIHFSRNNSLRNITVSRTRSSTDLHKK